MTSSDRHAEIFEKKQYKNNNNAKPTVNKPVLQIKM